MPKPKVALTTAACPLRGQIGNDVQSKVAGIPGVTVERSYPSEAGQPHGRAVDHIAPPCPLTRDQVLAALAAATTAGGASSNGTS